MPTINLGNPAGIWALLSLVPLIILYLIRPRPKEITIPSLMFFFKTTGANKLTSFLKQFTKDWLFLIQLLIVALLALTVAKPFTTYQHDITAENTVIVIDVSASMQTKEESTTRFDLAVKKARTLLGGKNSVILAKDVPQIGIKDASASDTLEYLNKILPTESGSRIGDSIILAGEVLGSEGRVIVLSDFKNTGGQDHLIAKAVLESKGYVVDFITFGSKKNNVGFVDMIIDEKETTIYVKNFNSEQVNVQFADASLKIASQATEPYVFATPEGQVSLNLNINDDNPADNILYISAPVKRPIRALIITNNASVFLRNALLASGAVEVEVAEPPIIPRGDYDVYVLHNIDEKQLLPGSIEDIGSRAEKGASVVIHAQEDSDTFDYKGLLPVNIEGRAEGDFVLIDQINRFTKNIDIGKVGYFWQATPKDNTLTLASVVNKPIMSYQKHGNGKVIYFGILENAGEFRFSTSYPIFWTELMKFLTNQQDVKQMNARTGSTMALDRPQTVQTPVSIVKQPVILLDQAGYYKLEDGRIIAANLLNDMESDVSTNETAGAKSTEFELKPVKEDREFEFAMPFIAISAIVLFLELLYIKMRGVL